MTTFLNRLENLLINLAHLKPEIAYYNENDGVIYLENIIDTLIPDYHFFIVPQINEHMKEDIDTKISRMIQHHKLNHTLTEKNMALPNQKFNFQIIILMFLYIHSIRIHLKDV